MITLLLLIGLAFFSFAVLIALGIGIVEAPWPILLIILVVSLSGMKWMSGQGRAIAPTRVEDAPDDSQHSTSSDQPLKYRGIAYRDDSHHEKASDEAQVQAESSDTESSDSLDAPQPETQSQTLHGVYRGQPWQHAEHTSHSDSSSDIVYRGQRVNKPHEE